nr:immunoglobulin light chain junction region [Macaca mulatta]MOW63829.1 immunoglobulin light chain junction region [Macaca mulatta]MOW64236.1 immunoglobulin light chain junction region [Macaca mulatta]
CLQYNNSPYSF